ncbi:cyanophycinase [Salegentibacter salegens]|uniref:Cyanophycinase n=1 Tax=Salegentibacter salegens TaxID=143223 RepID=A0A1M7LRL1_9FLAO|nr:cyanophycinase [Salegentibacter salegens]PRX52212.1 cyanophycinase [Salegentibacter salegens]SHM80922.1 cyanophycinase [Salegentibacter salegens]
MIKGTLIPIGGNEDKGFHRADRFRLDYISQGILSRVVYESGGNSSRILIITTASGIPEEVGQSYLDAFERLGCNNVSHLYIGSKEEANSEENLNLLKEADCVMFSGGNQYKITRNIKGTLFHDLLTKRYHEENFVLAGTSAGAMCMSKEMITGGSSKESFIKGAIKLREGLNLIPQLIIDTHFIQRGRFGRLSEAVARFPELIGFGLAEDTGIVIKNGNECDIIGSGMVIVFDPGKLKHNNFARLKEGTPLTMTNLITHVLSDGDSYYLKEREIRVMASSKSFIE